MEAVRINKYLSESGICSRREADRLIEAGLVLVNGEKAEPGMKVCGSERIEIEGRTISGPAAGQRPEPVILAFNKPRGLVCTSSDKDKAPNVIDYINYGSHIFTIGRLDKDSEGLILLTNYGELVNRINKKQFDHEKQYLVEVNRPLTEEFIRSMSEGVSIEVPLRNSHQLKRVKTQPCSVKRVDERHFEIILKEGMNRQIRRMTEELGFKVRRLKRVRIMNIELGGLREGEWRTLEKDEIRSIFDKAGLHF